MVPHVDLHLLELNRLLDLFDSINESTIVTVVLLKLLFIGTIIFYLFR